MDKYPPTLIEISHGDAEASVKLPWDVDIHQIINALRGMMVTIGFSDSQVISAMSEMVDENRRDEKTSTTYYSGTQVKHACVITMVITSVFWLAVLGVGKAEAPEEVVAEVYAAPLAYFHSATPPSNKAGWAMKDLTEDQFRTTLYSAGFRNLDDMSLPMMRRLFLAWHYKALYERVAKRTGINESVVFAYFIIEATVQGMESKLWREHWNPGGIKYRGQGDITFHHDDCGGVPCAFESISGFDEAIRIWSGVFNKPRYKDCKRRQIDDTCACLKKSGYYTGPGWKSRAAVARQYKEFIEVNFPNNDNV